MRRPMAVGAVMCLSLLGAGALTSAGSSPAVAGPTDFLPGVGPGPAMDYTIASKEEAQNALHDALELYKGSDMIKSTEWYSKSDGHYQAVVLAGDTVTWWEGLGYTENGSSNGFAPRAEFWAIDPEQSYFPATRAVLIPEPDTDANRVSQFTGSVGCAPGDPYALNARTLRNAWCYGGLYYRVVVADVTAADSGQMWNATTFDDGLMAAGGFTGADPYAVYISGPSNGTTGTYSAQEFLYVLDPKLELTKQVCTSTDEGQCDPAVDTRWVDSQLIPQGSSQAVFRITVENKGNVDLEQVHIAQDVVNPAAADAGKVGTPTLVGGGAVNGALLADTLAPGESASVVITVPLTGDLKGVLENVATANAELPSTITVDLPSGTDEWATTDPNTDPLIERFTGNPEDGDPAPHLVPSNEDAAEVYEPYPAIDLEKWVCQAGTGCTVPEGADLAALGSGEPAAGWVKATSVPMLSDAQWLLVVTNTGTVTLNDVTLSREDFEAGGASGYGPTTAECAVGTNLGTLEVNQSVTVTCTTAEITNTEAWDSGENVVNTAQVTARPEAPPILGLGEPPLITAESSAQVNTEVLPAEAAPPPGQDPPPTVRLPLLGATGANVVGAVVVGAVFLLTGTGLVVARTIRARRLAP